MMIAAADVTVVCAVAAANQPLTSRELQLLLSIVVYLLD